MANPLYQKYGSSPNMMQTFQQQFQQFRQSVQGDPQQIIQQKLQSGQITQDQVNAAYQQARQMGLMR